MINDLKRRLEEQRRTVKKLEERHKLYRKIPDGYLKVKISNGMYQYYFKEKDADEYKYIPAKEQKYAAMIAQKQYESGIEKELRKNCELLEKLISNYNPDALKGAYDKLCPGRKKIVTPIADTDKMYVESWYRKYPQQMNPYPEKGQYATDRGEMVRSKSEKILADLFYRKQIPYNYEPEIIFKDGSKVYPDFVLLNVRERKTYIWEHLGLASDDAYAKKNLKKIYQYEKNGYLPGEDLLISEETADMPLDLNLIRLKISKYLL